MALILRGKSWYVTYYVRAGDKRKKKFKMIGRKSDMPKSLATIVHDEIMRERRLGRLDFLTSVPTFSEFVPKFLDYQYTRLRRHTIAGMRSALKCMAEFFGNRRLTSITEADVRDFVRHRERGGIGAATIIYNMSVLRGFFDVARRLRMYAGDNPVGQFKYHIKPRTTGKSLTPDEEYKLLQYIPPGHHPLIEAALQTGMRKSELLVLKWADVDFSSDFIYVSEAKNQEPRKVPISKKLKDILTRHRLKTGYQPYVFLSLYNRPYIPDTMVLSEMMRAVCKKAGIRHFRFHDLRHTAATRMLERGAHPVDVAKILGHKHLSMVMAYAHPDASLRDAVELLSKTNI